MATEKDYPYTAKDGSCKDSHVKGVLNTIGYTAVKVGDGEQLKAAIAKQPVSVSVEADQTVFQHYKSGVIDSSSCGTATDHAILAVGYGTSNGEPYFLLRNSWGSGWGDKGYLRVEEKSSGYGICGVQKKPYYPKM